MAAINKLSDLAVRRAKAKERAYKLSDGGGLYLYVTAKGAKSWRMKYRFGGKERTATFGLYPAVSLSQARAARDEIKAKLAAGLDPAAKEEPGGKTFAEVAEEYFDKTDWRESHRVRQRRRVEIYIAPHIGARRIDEITKAEIIELIDAVATTPTRTTRQTDKSESARRVYAIIRQVYRYALARDYTTVDPTTTIDISTLLPKRTHVKMRAIVDPAGVRGMWRMIREYPGIVRYPLMFLALSALRPGNVQKMRWEWIDLDERSIEIPAEAMKAKRPYRMPMTEEMAAIIEEMQPHRRGSVVFPSPIYPSQPISENTLNLAHRRLGLDHSAHGWRSSFSTICYRYQREHGYSAEVIEAQLDHVIGNAVTRAYMRGDFYDERRGLLEWWGEWLMLGAQDRAD